MPTSTENIFYAFLEIGFKLTKSYETANSNHYENYLTSISDLHQQFKTHLDEEGGITTPTNIKSFESLPTISPHQENERKNGDRRFSLEGSEESCGTPVQNSLTVSPSEDMALTSTKLERSSNFNKV